MGAKRRVALGAVVVYVALGCEKPPAASPASPALAAIDPPEIAEGEHATLWREGTPGRIVLFVRNIVDRKVQRTATSLADDFVSHCEPAYDAIAVVEPGIALVVPGIHARADEELATRRRWRARCLTRKNGDPPDVAAERAKEQVQLVVDEKNAVRRDLLAGGDPEADIVVAAYGSRGEPLFLRGIAADASWTDRDALYTEAIATLTSSSRAPDRK